MEHDKSKEQSIYMRFHVTLQKSMSFAKNVYGNHLVPQTKIRVLEHAIQISGLTQQIESQDYLNYHLTWLTGILRDTLSMNEQAYKHEIDNILSELYQDEADRIKKYIQQLTYAKHLPPGQRYRKMLGQVGDMDVVPCYIQIFELYSYCLMWQEQGWERGREQYEGFLSYAYLFWYKAISKHLQIGKNIKDYIKHFFRKILEDQGGMNHIKQKADTLFNSF